MTEPGSAPADTMPATLPQSNPVTGWRRIGTFVGPAISVGILVAALWQLKLHALDWHKSLAIIRQSPTIWLVLGLNYLSGPVGDWVIFRKLWKIPVEGIFPLIKKMIGNQILLSYVGEVYFYDWARRHVKMEGSPFGAVKDVAILSAIAGYLMTLIMMLLAWPYIQKFDFGVSTPTLLWAIAIMLATGLAITVFRNRLLSLPRADLLFVLGVHMVRLSVNTVLTAVLWSLMLPAVPLSSWLILSTGRLLVTRLPLIPNQEIAFAGAVTLLHGSANQTDNMISVIALFITAIHIVVYITMLILDLAQRERNA
jgi:hypothetical protein